MKFLTALSACALLALATPAFAQSASGTSKDLRQNGSPSGVAPSHAKEPGLADAGSGRHAKVKEGRSSASDANTGGKTGGVNNMQTGTGGASGSGSSSGK